MCSMSRRVPVRRFAGMAAARAMLAESIEAVTAPPVS